MNTSGQQIDIPAATPARIHPLTDREFEVIKTWVHETVGISLSSQKKALVMGRLSARLRYHGVQSYGQYFHLLKSQHHQEEVQIALDLLTTNETHFFRELPHFEFLRSTILPQHPARLPFRVWSAASSSGEEAYSIAMTLADGLGEAPWEVLASDVSRRMLARAIAGHYPMTRAQSIPQPLLQTYCLKGIGPQAGTFLIAPQLRRRVQFRTINLNRAFPVLGDFDVIFLRNVMIYFDEETRRQVLARVAACLRQEGYLFIGHSESLNGITTTLKAIAPAIYRKR